MGTQRPVVIGEELNEELGGPIVEHHGKKKLKTKSEKLKVEEKIKAEKYRKPAEKPVEKTEEPTVEQPKEATEEKQEKPKKTKVGKAKVRSSRYKKAQELIDRQKIYDFVTAIDLVKKTSLSKFDGNVEVHLRLLAKNGKPENIRGTLKYPHATGKKIEVAILDEKKILEIEKSGKVDFDIAVTTPVMMPQVAKLAKILGPKGKMPNPKSGTIGENPEKIKEELEGGMSEYKTDASGIIHQVIGKVSAEPKILEENFRALISVLPQERIVSSYLCATMGPSVKVLTK